MLYRPSDTFNRSAHLGEALKTIDTRRWSILLSDQFEYLPDSPLFALGTMSGLPISPSISPDDVVLIGRNVPWATNMAVAEATHNQSVRSSITGSFTYGILRFLKGGLVGNSMYGYSAGYNYQLTKIDTAGFRYAEERFSFNDSPMSVLSRAPTVVFEHRVASQLLLHVEAGPESYSLWSGSDPPVGRWSWLLDAGLESRIRKYNFASRYFHGTSSGSGVLVGSELNAIMGRVEGRISDGWSAQAETSWSRNVAIIPKQTDFSNLTVVMAGAGIERCAFTNGSIYLRYMYAAENRPQTCIGTACAAGVNRHMVELGMRISRSTDRRLEQNGK
jgi:hypothetical protein